MDGDAADAVTIPDAKSGYADTAAQFVTDGNPNRDAIRNSNAAVRNADTHTERHSDTYADAHSDAFADANADPVVCVQRETEIGRASCRERVCNDV